MSYIVFLVLAVVFAVIPAFLIVRERKLTPEINSARAAWAKDREFIYSPEDQTLLDDFHRGAMVNHPDSSVVEVAHGAYFGNNAYVFDLGLAATVVALHRGASSAALLDLRPTNAAAPTDPSMSPLGALGPRVLYTNNPEVARRVADRRMVSFAEQVPLYIEVLWNEGAWTLAQIPTTEDPDDLDETLEAIRRFNDLLRVLPPEGHGRVGSQGGPRDPGQPVPARQQGRR